jgi:hypothetical protein
MDTAKGSPTPVQADGCCPSARRGRPVPPHAARRGFVTAADPDGSPLRSPASSCAHRVDDAARFYTVAVVSLLVSCLLGTLDDQLRHLPTQAGVRRTL